MEIRITDKSGFGIVEGCTVGECLVFEHSSKFRWHYGLIHDLYVIFGPIFLGMPQKPDHCVYKVWIASEYRTKFEWHLNTRPEFRQVTRHDIAI